MRGMFGLGVGIFFGFLIILALVSGEERKRLRYREPPATGLELLAPGATEWKRLRSIDGTAVTGMWLDGERRLLVKTQGNFRGAYWDGSSWVATQEMRLEAPFHPTVVDSAWTHLTHDTWLMKKKGDCAPRVEPAGQTLPVLPRCKPANEFQVRAAVRLDDQSILVVLEEEPGRYRGLQLAAGAPEWRDLGPVPIECNFAALVAGVGGTAVLTNGHGTMAVWDGKGWRELPKTRADRYGWEAALAADGTVFAWGGFTNHAKEDRRYQWGLALLVFALYVGALVLMRVRWKISVVWGIIGLPIGLAIGVGWVFALIFFLSA